MPLTVRPGCSTVRSPRSSADDIVHADAAISPATASPTSTSPAYTDGTVFDLSTDVERHRRDRASA
jgi:hypothetical protein